MSFQDLLIPELINHIAINCDVNSLCKLRLTSKEIRNVIDFDAIKILYIKSVIPEFIHEYIDFNSNFMLNSQHVDIGTKFGIGYIDFFQPNDFINNNYKTNIIYGYDHMSRFFISILYKDLIDSKNKIVTFFQRYSENPPYYVSCQNTFIYSSYCATFYFSYNKKITEIYEILFKLINHGKAENNIKID